MQSCNSFESIELNIIEFTPSQASVPVTASMPKKNSLLFVIMITCIVITLLCITGCVIYMSIRSGSKCDESFNEVTTTTTAASITTLATVGAKTTASITTIATITAQASTTSTQTTTSDWVWIRDITTAKPLI